MKNIKLTAVFLSAISLITISSCTSLTETVDQDLLDNLVNNTSIAGIYRMTAFNTGISTDLNNDGTASVNQLSETSCFNNNSITINVDGTFTATSNGLEVSANDSLECYTDPEIAGTWVLNNNLLTLTYTENNSPEVEVFLVSGNSLTISIPLGEIVSTTSTNTAVYLNSSYVIIYTR